jgi:hypothetical protein
MKELKIVWGRKASEQKQVLIETANPTMKDLIDRALKYMGTLQSPLYYETPDGWFTKTTWNKWGEGVELTARVDFHGGFLFIMEIRERAIARNLATMKIG